MTATPSPSGLPAVDRQWGGLARGRAYLLVGRAGAGRSALALQTVRAAVEAGERCLVISPRAPEALVEIGTSVGLDLAAAHGSGALRLLRVPSAADLAARGPEGLAKSYRDLAGLVAADQPGRVVVEDFTPLVQFDTFERFHAAFSGLVGALRDQGATLVIGLGDPANDASRRLLDVVEGLVDGTIHLGAGGDLVLSTPGHPDYPSSDGSSVDAAPPEAPPSPEAGDPAASGGTPDDPTAAGGRPAGDASAASGDSPTASGEAPDETPAASGQSAREPEAPAQPTPDPADAPAPDSAPAPPASAKATATPEADPAAEAFETTFSVAGAAPEPPSPTPAPAQTAPPADTAPPEAPGSTGSGGPVETEIVPPPPPDPSLQASGTDPFGHDPADALFEQGYLADSGPQAAAPRPPVVSPPVAPPPVGLPSFTSLAAAPVAADPGVAFRTALDAAFAGRAQAPFVVVALRMDPAVAASAHFGAVADGLRASARPADHVLVDDAWKRAAVLLPASGPETGQALFAGLQAHLQRSLGAAAGAVLQAVAAVTVPDGQPFQTAAELMAYAFEG